MYVYCTIGMIQFGTKCDKLCCFFLKLRWPDDSNYDDILFTLLHLLIICQTVGDIALRYLSLSLCLALIPNYSVSLGVIIFTGHLYLSIDATYHINVCHVTSTKMSCFTELIFSFSD